VKILLTNYLLDSLGGTESWIYTVASYLHLNGHEVTIYSPNLGWFGLTYLSFAKLTHTPPREKFDLIISNHNSCFEEVKDNPARKILNCHSAFLEVENFIEGADEYVSISKEIRRIQKQRGFDSKVIMNPIDFDRFTFHPSKGLKKVLHFSKERNPAS